MRGTDAVVEKCARRVRAWLVSHRAQLRLGGKTPGKCMRGLCSIASVRLFRDLKRRGYSPMLVMYEDDEEQEEEVEVEQKRQDQGDQKDRENGNGRGHGFAHVYILVDGVWIVDVTASQLSERCAAVEYRRADEARMQRPEWNVAACRIFSSVRDLVRYQKLTSWPADQIYGSRINMAT